MSVYFYSFSLGSLIIIPIFNVLKEKYSEGLLIALMLSELTENKIHVPCFT